MVNCCLNLCHENFDPFSNQDWESHVKRVAKNREIADKTGFLIE